MSFFAKNSRSCITHQYATGQDHLSSILAYDQYLFIFDRFLLKADLIETPDPQYNITAVVFSQSAIYFAKDNKKLYQYSNEQFHSIDVPICIHHIASNSYELICLGDDSLWSLSFLDLFETSELKKISKINNTTVISSSPCSRALMCFSYDEESYGTVFYKNSFFQFPEPFTHFAWQNSDLLSAVTSNSSNQIKYWVEKKPNQFITLSSYQANSEILSLTFCRPNETNQDIKEFDGKIQCIEPQSYILLFVTLIDGTCLFLEGKSLKLLCIDKYSNNPCKFTSVMCDLTYKMESNSLYKRIRATIITEKTFSSYIYEFHDKRLTHSGIMWQLHLFDSPVISLFSIENCPLIKLQNNEEFLIKDSEMIPYKNEIQENDIYLTNKDNFLKSIYLHEKLQLQIYKNFLVVIHNNQIFENPFNNPILRYFYQVFNDRVIIGILKDDLTFSITYFLFESDLFYSTTISTDFHTEFDPNNFSVVFHSTDFFVISIPGKIIPYQYSRHEKHYLNISSFDTGNAFPIIAFLRGQYPILIAFYNTNYTFFQMTSLGLMPLNFSESHKNLRKQLIGQHSIINMISINENEFWTVTKHFIRKIDFNPLTVFSDQIHYFGQNSKRAFLTSLSLSFIKIANSIDIQNSHQFKLNAIEQNFTNNISDDPLSYRYSMFFSLIQQYPELLKYSPYYSLWALFSPKQDELIQSLELKSLNDLTTLLIPLWASSTDILKLAFEQAIKGFSNFDAIFDRSILICFSMNNTLLASVISTKCNKNALSSILRKSDLEELQNGEKSQKKMLTNAYTAQQCGRLELSAAFFLAAGDAQSALSLLRRQNENDPSLDHQLIFILVSRFLQKRDDFIYMIDHLTFPPEDQVICKFYKIWWKNSPDEAIQFLFNHSFPFSVDVSLKMIQYELLRQIGHKNIRMLFDILDIPSLTSAVYIDHPFTRFIECSNSNSDSEEFEVLNESIEDRSSRLSMPFDFGSKQWQMLEVIESVEDIPTQFNSKILSFDSNLPKVLVSETKPQHSLQIHSPINEIISQLSCLYHIDYSLETIQFLQKELQTDLSLMQKMFILFSIAFVLSDSKTMINLSTKELSDINLPQLIKYYDFPVTLTKTLPSFAWGLTRYKYPISNDDRLISNLLIFQQMKDRFIPLFEEIPHSLNNYFIEFINDIYWGMLYQRIPQKSYINEFVIGSTALHTIIKHSLSIDMNSFLNIYSTERNNLKYLLALTTSDHSFFLNGNTFHYEEGRLVKTNSTHQIRMLLIDQIDNTNIAAFTSNGEMIPLKSVAKKDIDKCSALSFEAESTVSNPNLLKKVISTLTNISPFDKEITASDTCSTSSHFVTGNQNGSISLWSYESTFHKRYRKINTFHFTKEKIHSLQFSPNGSNLLIKGNQRLLLSDFSSVYFEMDLNPSYSVHWINNENQFLVCSPSSVISMFDTRCSNSANSPIITFSKQSQRGQETSDENIYIETNPIPLALKGPILTMGHNNGAVDVMDLRIPSLIGTLNLHSDKVTALNFDPSGAFIISGSADNSIHILHTSTLNEIQSYQNILDDDILGANVEYQRGITTIATSRRAIAVGGFSSSITVFNNFAY